MRAGVRERAQRFAAPRALQVQRATHDGDGDARAAGAELVVERARIVAALRHDEPRPAEDRRELALEEAAVRERGGGQPFGPPDVVVDVAVVPRQHGQSITAETLRWRGGNASFRSMKKIIVLGVAASTVA